MELPIDKNTAVGFVIIVALHLVFQIGKFAWDILKDKTAVKDETLKDTISTVKKLNKDLNRYYFGLKFLAGDKWPEVKSFIEDDPEKEH